MRACQWSGVAIVTASIDLSSSSRRKSFSVRGGFPAIFSTALSGLANIAVVDVADGDDLGVGIGGEHPRQVGSAVAQADHGDPDPLARPRPVPTAPERASRPATRRTQKHRR